VTVYQLLMAVLPNALSWGAGFAGAAPTIIASSIYNPTQCRRGEKSDQQRWKYLILASADP
jgi:hypothetical protein